ncbi:hypothetical protein D9758_011818 [Tetrapyrgos nigripes]|uniref:Uncharacterized protein n=1 Tax=Tetrapyrgos nigripes TaxID=182062 RepID=A0A8H5FN90_9AGAR|nr:hypothetical protein D9758_011818 [Tetrapyrgos nigripes]
MSSNTCEIQFLEVVIHTVGQAIIIVSVVYMVYGVYLAVTLLSMHVLVSRGIRNSRARMILFIIAMLQLLVSTSYAVITVVFDGFIFLRGKATVEWFTNWMYTATQLGIVNTFLMRLNFLFSDGIMVWRTWVLYPHNKTVRIVLVLCMIISTVANFVDAGISTARALHMMEQRTMIGMVDFPGDQALIMALPLLVTNAVCTFLISYKTWCHRQDVKKNLTASGTPQTKAGKILMLLVESGMIYCAIWVAYVIVQVLYSDFESQTGTLWTIANTFTFVVPMLAALFPMFIILIAALEDPQNSTNGSNINIHIPSSLTISMQFAIAKSYDDHSASEYDSEHQNSNRISVLEFPRKDDQYDLEAGGGGFDESKKEPSASV